MDKKYIIILILIILLGIICASMFLSDKSSMTNGDSNFTDVGTTKNSSNDWIILKSVNKTITSKGTILSTEHDRGAYANKPGTSNDWEGSFDWSAPFTVEFDILNWTGKPSMRIVDKDNNSASQDFSKLRIKNNSHVKIVSDNSSIKYVVDGKTMYSEDKAFNDAQIGFRMKNATIEYKNFKIY